MSAINTALEDLVAGASFNSDWADVVGRAGVTDRRSLWRAIRGRRRWAVALAAVVAVIVIGSALGAAGIGPFGAIHSWLTGTPGKPASVAAQRAFASHNGNSWASFPRTTRLRQLIDVRFDGQRYILYGFRSGNSVCLTLRAVTLQASLPPACAPVSVVARLSAPLVPIVAARVVPAFPERRSPQVSFGIAADSVTGVEVDATDGEHPASLGGNAYLWVEPSPNTANRVSAITASLRTGRHVSVAVNTFSLFAAPLEARRATGPARVETRLQRPHIGWIERGEKRGLSPAQAHLTPAQRRGFGSGSDARLVKPDPSSDIVVGISGGCLYLEGAVGCNSLSNFFSRGPFTFMTSGGGANGSDAFIDVGGAAADGVTAIKAFLPDGTSESLALKDNLFAGVVPSAQPLRLVAYNSAGRVVGVETMPIFARPAPPSARHLKQAATVTGGAGGSATLSLGPTIDNLRCWRVATSAGPAQGLCERRSITGPWVSLTGLQPAGSDVFVFGTTRDPVATVQLRFADGITTKATLVNGWFIAAVPKNELSRERKKAVVEGLDAAGHVVQQPAFFFKAKR
jgi:hypothetical protein